jgi:hypothetical protein
MNNIVGSPRLITIRHSLELITGGSIHMKTVVSDLFRNWSVFSHLKIYSIQMQVKYRRGRDRMVVGFIATYAIRAYHY